VRDTKEFSVDNEPPISIYHPHEQFPIGTMFLVVRSTQNASTLTAGITKEIRDLDPELPAYEFKTMEQRRSDSLSRRRFSTFLLGVFATVALVLAAIGLYGVLAYSVTQRTQEIGIRMALGAEPGKIMSMIVRHSMVLVVVGVAIGLLGAWAVTRVMASLLYGVSTTDGLTFAGPPLILMAVALLASYFPARRAARVDPTVALRSE
jgi:putative ABC transport system permease protein